MGRFCGENGRLPTLGVEADFNQVVENIGRNAGFLRDLKAKTDRVVNPPELYGPVVRRLAERLSYMRHNISEAEFLEAVQEAAIEFGREHEGRAPNPESSRDFEEIVTGYLPEALAKRAPKS